MVKWVSEFPGPRLVILNTVKSAATIAERFSSNCTRKCVEHISTALTPFDRAKTLKRIETRLGDPSDTDWTLVATSCVEAGVNLSFRTGFRERSSLLSLLQTSGRVNREGHDTCAQTWTFKLAEVPGLDKNLSLKHASDILDYYFKDKEIQINPGLSTDSIKREIEKWHEKKEEQLVMSEENCDFPTVEKCFKVIDSDARLVVVDPKMIEKFKSGNIANVNWQELQQTSVHIECNKIKNMKLPEVPGIGEDKWDRIYIWDRGYDDFLGYMVAFVKSESDNKLDLDS